MIASDGTSTIDGSAAPRAPTLKRSTSHDERPRSIDTSSGEIATTDDLVAVERAASSAASTRESDDAAAGSAGG